MTIYGNFVRLISYPVKLVDEGGKIAMSPPIAGGGVLRILASDKNLVG